MELNHPNPITILIAHEGKRQFMSHKGLTDTGRPLENDFLLPPPHIKHLLEILARHEKISDGVVDTKLG